MPVKINKIKPLKLTQSELLELTKKVIKVKPIKEEIFVLSGSQRRVRINSSAKGFLVISSKGNHHLPKLLTQDQKHAELVFKQITKKLVGLGAKNLIQDAILLDI